MTTEIKLSDTAKAMLIGAGETGYAAPTRIPPAALRAVANSLERQQLVRFVKPRVGSLQVKRDGEVYSLKLTAAGRRAVGLTPAAKVAAKPERTAAAPRTDTKQARVIEMLRGKNGVSIDEVAKETGWQRHTVRGFFAGLKKKGFNVVGGKTVDDAPDSAGRRLRVYSLAGA